MPGLYRDTGIVLRTRELGETDRIVVFLLRGRGKRSGVAKGARKPRSQFAGRLQPGAHVAVQLYEGRSELHTVTQAESIDQWRAITSDLDRFAWAAEIIEAVDGLVPDGGRDPRLHDMLVGALRTVDQHGSPLVVPAFMLKLLAHEGLSPSLDECGACGAQPPLVAFHLDSGGLLCPRCRRGQSISPEAVELMRRILGGGLAGALAEVPGPEVNELDGIMGAAMEAHLERGLRSRRVARQL